MRTLAIGDIHGCFRSLTALAACVPFLPDDVLVTLGDYVDRGPDSRAVIDWLIYYQQHGRLVPLRGNHEVMMLKARRGGYSLGVWLGYGGKAALASYSPLGDEGRITDVPGEHWRFIEETLLWHETPTHFFVHANAYPDREMQDQPEYMLLWEVFDHPPPHESGKVMVCGHTSQKSGVPLNIGHAICIDTFACGGEWLTCLDVESGKYWQANESGQTRAGWLDKLR